MGDPRKVTAEIRRKMEAKEGLTQRDLSDLANVARMSGRMVDKLLFVDAKAYREENPSDKQPTAEERKAELVEAVELAREKGMRTSNPNDILAYVEAKQALAEANEEGDQQAE
jgi:hypothetical protein